MSKTTAFGQARQVRLEGVADPCCSPPRSLQIPLARKRSDGISPGRPSRRSRFFSRARFLHRRRCSRREPHKTSSESRSASSSCHLNAWNAERSSPPCSTFSTGLLSQCPMPYVSSFPSMVATLYFSNTLSECSNTTPSGSRSSTFPKSCKPSEPILSVS